MQAPPNNPGLQPTTNVQQGNAGFIPQPQGQPQQQMQQQMQQQGNVIGQPTFHPNQLQLGNAFPLHNNNGQAIGAFPPQQQFGVGQQQLQGGGPVDGGRLYGAAGDTANLQGNGNNPGSNPNIVLQQPSGGQASLGVNANGNIGGGSNNSNHLLPPPLAIGGIPTGGDFTSYAAITGGAYSPFGSGSFNFDPSARSNSFINSASVGESLTDEGTASKVATTADALRKGVRATHDATVTASLRRCQAELDLIDNFESAFVHRVTYFVDKKDDYKRKALDNKSACEETGKQRDLITLKLRSTEGELEKEKQARKTAEEKLDAIERKQRDADFWREAGISKPDASNNNAATASNRAGEGDVNNTTGSGNNDAQRQQQQQFSPFTGKQR